MSNDKLLSALKASQGKNKTRKIKKIRHKFSRQEIKEIKRIFMR